MNFAAVYFYIESRNCPIFLEVFYRTVAESSGTKALSQITQHIGTIQHFTYFSTGAGELPIFMRMKIMPYRRVICERNVKQKKKLIIKIPVQRFEIQTM